MTGAAFAQGGRTSANILPATNGQTVGNQDFRWHVFAGDLDVSGDLTINGVKFNGGNPVFPLTTKGDLMGYGTSTARVPVGTNGQCLVADSTQPLGLKWGACVPSALEVDSLTVGTTFLDAKGVYNVKAKCDGTTDDTSVIQTAITAAASAGGGTLSLPQGTCNFTALTIGADNIYLKGAGRGRTILKKTSANADGITIAGAAAETPVIVAGLFDLTLQGPGAGVGTGRGLVTAYVGDLNIQNVEIKLHGAQGWDAHDTYTATLVNVQTNNNGASGFRCTAVCNALNFTGASRFGGNSTYGIEIAGGFRTLNFTGSIIEGNGSDGVLLASQGFGINLDGAYFEANNTNTASAVDIRITAQVNGLHMVSAQHTPTSHTAAIRVDAGGSLTGVLQANSGSGTTYYVDDQGSAGMTWVAANNAQGTTKNRLGTLEFNPVALAGQYVFSGNNSVPGVGVPIAMFDAHGSAVPFSVQFDGEELLGFSGKMFKLTGIGTNMPMQLLNNTFGAWAAEFRNQATGGIAVGLGSENRAVCTLSAAGAVKTCFDVNGVPIIPALQSTTGKRYLCIATDGTVNSQAAACSGT